MSSFMSVSFPCKQIKLCQIILKIPFEHTENVARIQHAQIWKSHSWPSFQFCIHSLNQPQKQVHRKYFICTNIFPVIIPQIMQLLTQYPCCTRYSESPSDDLKAYERMCVSHMCFFHGFIFYCFH